MIQWLTHSSKAIQNFPMGDPHERTFPVYLPPGYDAKRSEPYPVVSFLAGFSGKGSGYIADNSAFGIPLAQRFDDAIRRGTLKPFIAYFPDGTSKMGCSQYVNSPAFGNYLDYITQELPEFIDENFHTHRSRDYRAVVGHSSGGFGALVIGMMRPEAFSYILSSAGDGFYEASLLPNVNVVMIELQKHGTVANFIQYFLGHPNPGSLSPREFDTMLTLAMAPCYAPNVNSAPLFGDLFFDEKTGAILPDVWEKYLAWDPVRMVDRYVANLKKLKCIRLEAGLQDEHALQWAHRQVAAKLTQHGIAVEVEEYPGPHGGHHWRFEGRLTRILNHMQ
jgi:enterochelin esterase-like enzyme